MRINSRDPAINCQNSQVESQKHHPQGQKGRCAQLQVNEYSQTHGQYRDCQQGQTELQNPTPICHVFTSRPGTGCPYTKARATCARIFAHDFVQGGTIICKLTLYAKFQARAKEKGRFHPLERMPLFALALQVARQFHSPDTADHLPILQDRHVVLILYGH